MTEKGKILFVDDERQILIALRALFRAKYDVFIANSGDEALEIIRREHIHAVISDQRMPRMTGAELLREVKKISPSTMRLLLTGYSDLKSIMDSINEGEVFRFINKPWDNAALQATVDSAVQIALNTVHGVTQEEDAPAATFLPPVPQDVPVEAEGAGLLIIDDDESTLAKVQELFHGVYPIFNATSAREAVDILEREEIAVIIADVVVNGTDTTDFIKALKELHPLIMTIIITESIDSDMAIELINHGQIFRYLRKPIGPGMLRISVNNGMRFYMLHKNKPTLLQRYRVDVMARLRQSPMFIRLKTQLRLLRDRLHFGT